MFSPPACLFIHGRLIVRIYRSRRDRRRSVPHLSPYHGILEGSSDEGPCLMLHGEVRRAWTSEVGSPVGSPFPKTLPACSYRIADVMYSNNSYLSSIRLSSLPLLYQYSTVQWHNLVRVRRLSPFVYLTQITSCKK